MKQKTLNKFIALTFGCLFFGACSEDKLPENATIYDKAVFNQERSKKDRIADKTRHPGKILSFAGLNEGMKVADVSAGDGYYSELASYIVGAKGQVYLQNGLRYVSKSSAKIDARLTDDRLKNVTRIDSSYADLQLPDELDMILLMKVFHDIYVPRGNPGWNADEESYFAQLHKALKPGGKVLLIDHSAKLGSGKDAAKTLHRIDESFVQKAFESRGFKLVKQSEILRNPGDDRETKVFTSKIRGKTDRFVFLFEKI